MPDSEFDLKYSSAAKRMTRKAVGLLAVLPMLVVACMPSAGEISGATSTELDRACQALRAVGYDYWGLDAVAIGGRTLEVAADIHTAHPGPEQTREFCEGR